MTTATSTWLDGADASAFPLHSLPYGVVTHPERATTPTPAVAIGGWALPLGSLASTGLLDRRGATPTDARAWFGGASLDPFLLAGRPAWTAARQTITAILADEAYREIVAPLLLPLDEVTNHLPFTVGDYVDFYSSEHHARNVGAIFRPDGEALTPNWKHLPIGYHGRAGTVVVSGTDVVRPYGLQKPPTAPAPTWGPEAKLDIEAEVGFVVGGPRTEPGSRVATADVRDRVFGVVLLNDWSARATQAFEYVPLGPFLGKSFLTSISAWVVPLDALEAAMVPPVPQDPTPAEHLRDGQWGLDLAIEVRVGDGSPDDAVVARPPFAQMYWTPAQQLAHLTANGATTAAGDLYASGTVSGAEPGQRGSFLELSWNGTEPFALADGTTRRFLEDGDVVTITATAPGPSGALLHLGPVTGRILPSRA